MPRKIRRDYSQKQFSNNLFKKKKRRIEKRKVKIRFGMLAGFFAIVAFLWLILFSGIFNIKEIQVEGNDALVGESIKAAAWNQTLEKRLLIFKQKNILFFSKNELIDNLKKSYFFDQLTIKKKNNSSMKIEFSQKAYSLVWLEDEKYYYINKDGEIIQETSAEELADKSFPLIENQSEARITGKSVADSADILNLIAELFEKLKSGDTAIEVKKFFIDESEDTVKLKIKDGGEVYFSTRLDIDSQIKKLAILIENKLKEDYKNKKYIDLRYGDAVYYQ